MCAQRKLGNFFLRADADRLAADAIGCAKEGLGASTADQMDEAHAEHSRGYGAVRQERATLSFAVAAAPEEPRYSRGPKMAKHPPAGGI
jgi:hypothetical protein